MNDSQAADYLEIINSLLASRQQWDQVPEIVSLTVKAMIRLLEQHSQSFVQHKTLINEQSLKIKQLELRLGSKISKKDLEGEVLSILNSRPASVRRDEESMSQYEKLIKQSRYQKDRGYPPTVEELKTIAEIITEKRMEQTNNELKNKLLSQKLEIQDRIATLKEEMKSRMVEIEKERREWVSQCRQAHSRMEQSVIRPSYTLNDDKIGQLEHSNKRMSEGLSHLINHLQQNFLTKQEVNLLIDRQKEKEKQKQKKIYQKSKPKQGEKHKHKQQDYDLQKITQVVLKKLKNEQHRQWNEFKQSIHKEIGQMVNTQTVNNLIDSFQKNMFQKYTSISSIVSKLQNKINTLSRSHEGHGKEILIKSEKRVQKKSSPSKSIQSIQTSLVRLQKTVLERQLIQLRRLQDQIDGKIKKYDQKLTNQLDRRQKHLCQVIQQTYNQCTNVKIQHDNVGDYRGSIKKLFQTNLCCRYLYIGTRQCKKDTCIPWQKQALNNVVDNFVWKKDSPIVMVNGAGLYRLQVGLYGDIDSQTVLLINGDPFAIVPLPQNSRSTGAKIRGTIFSQILLLPGKSKLSVRVGQHFYGQSFLFMQQL